MKYRSVSVLNVLSVFLCFNTATAADQDSGGSPAVSAPTPVSASVGGASGGTPVQPPIVTAVTTAAESVPAVELPIIVNIETPPQTPVATSEVAPALSTADALSGTSVAEDDDLDSGIIPVPNIDERLKRLGGTTTPEVDKRHTFLKKLLERYSLQVFEKNVPEENRLAVLNNLQEVAEKTYALSKELNDEDWLVQESLELKSIAFQGLLRYSPVEPATLIHYFSLLPNQRARNDAIKYYREKRVPVETNPENIEKLLVFTGGALKIIGDLVQESKEEGWMIESVQTLGKALTQKLLELDPRHEGVYSVKFTCTEFQKGCESAINLNRMVILDTRTATGTIVVFFSDIKTLSGPGLSTAYYFSGAIVGSNAGNTVSATSGIGDIRTQNSFKLELDPRAGTVLGWVKDNRRHGPELRFEGQQLITPAELFREDLVSETIDAAQIPGEYQVHFENCEGGLTQMSSKNVSACLLDGQLSITKSEDTGELEANFYAQVAQTFNADPYEEPFLQFKAVKFTQSLKRGILLLHMYLGDNSYVKWVVGSQNKAQGIWRGIGFSSHNGTYTRFTMTRIGEALPGPMLPVRASESTGPISK